MPEFNVWVEKKKNIIKFPFAREYIEGDAYEIYDWFGLKFVYTHMFLADVESPRHSIYTADNNNDLSKK